MDQDLVEILKSNESQVRTNATRGFLMLGSQNFDISRKSRRTGKIMLPWNKIQDASYLSTKVCNRLNESDKYSLVRAVVLLALSPGFEFHVK